MDSFSLLLSVPLIRVPTQHPMPAFHLLDVPYNCNSVYPSLCPVPISIRFPCFIFPFESIALLQFILALTHDCEYWVIECKDGDRDGMRAL